jgi:protein SCO1/2
MKPPLARLLFCLGCVAVALRAEPAPFAGEVRFDQRIGQPLPLATMVLDVDGGRHPLGEFFHDRPVVLYFGYANCPQLCAVVADGTVAALRQLRRAVGRDVDVIALSIDPAETALAARARLNEAVHRYGDPASIRGWHYLRGSGTAIRAITDAAGFHFVYDARSQQFAHPSGFVVVTPQGVISRYFLGVDFDATEVARAVDRAAASKTGQPVLALLLQCFRGDGFSGRYSGLIWRALALAVTATVVALAGGVAWMLRAEFRRRRRIAEELR